MCLEVPVIDFIKDKTLRLEDILFWKSNRAFKGDKCEIQFGSISQNVPMPSNDHKYYFNLFVARILIVLGVNIKSIRFWCIQGLVGYKTTCLCRLFLCAH